jgi:hypothetical protein
MVTLKCKLELDRFDLVILSGVFNDLELQHELNLSRDRSYLFDRISNEGRKVTTTLLPSLGKAIYSSFETGVFSCPDCFRLYRKAGVCYRYPAFLNALFSLVYDDEGKLFNEPDITAIQSLVQITFMFYKLEDDMDKSLVTDVLNQFKKTESEVINHEDLTRELTKPELLLASQALNSLLSNFDPYDRIPRHGPGVTSDKASCFGKFRATTYPDEARFLFPREDFLHVNEEYSKLEDSVRATKNKTFRTKHGVFNTHDFLDQMPGGSEYEDFGASIKFVPKDSRGPRLISCEPALMQYLQQSVMGELYKYVEAAPLTKGHVNFTDQTINQSLVIESSVSRKRCTLDLKEASDRVSNAHLHLFPEPLRSALLVLRSRKTSYSADRSEDSVIEMKKYAPMGSALCFPVEALVFWALGVAAIQIKNNVSLSAAADRLYVYGDDIIADTPDYTCISNIYDRAGLLVNHEKSFHRGFFRESCGADYYKGMELTPTRVKRTPSAYWLTPHKFVPKKKVSDDYLAILSLTSLSDNLFKKGYWQTSRAIDSLFVQMNKGFIAGLPGHGCLMATMNFTISPYHYGEMRDDDGLQKPRVRTYRASAIRRNRLERDDYLGYLQWYCTGSGMRKTPRGHIRVSRGWFSC